MDREHFRNLLVSAFFLFAFLAVPLYYHNAYFDMLEAKSSAAHMGVCLFLAAAAGSALLPPAPRDGRPKLPCPVCLLDGLLPAFAAVVLISCLCSGQAAAAFFGTKGWGVGGFLMIGLIAVWFAVSRWLRYVQNLWLPVIAVNCLIFLLGIFHSAGWDVLALHKGIAPQMYYLYISTIGNLNWYVGYLSLLMPLFSAFYLLADEPASEALYLCFLAPGCLNMVLCASDGLYLGLGVCAFFAVPLVCTGWAYLRKAGLLLVLFGTSLLLVGTVPVFADKVESMDGVAKSLLSPVCAAGILLVGAILILWGWCGIHRKTDPVQLRLLCILAENGLVLVALAFLMHTVRTFDDAWGSERGLIWRSSIEIYNAFPWKNKLLGTGPELLRAHYAVLSAHFSRTLLAAHSEPLQLLLTTGVLSLLPWCGAWTFLFVSYFRQKLWRTDALPFFLPLAAYFGQCLVNSPQATNVTLLCVMAALLRQRFPPGTGDPPEKALYRSQHKPDISRERRNEHT